MWSRDQNQTPRVFSSLFITKIYAEILFVRSSSEVRDSKTGVPQAQSSPGSKESLSGGSLSFSLQQIVCLSFSCLCCYSSTLCWLLPSVLIVWAFLCLLLLYFLGSPLKHGSLQFEWISYWSSPSSQSPNYSYLDRASL